MRGSEREDAGVIWKAGRSTTYASSWRLLSIFNSAEGSANNAIAIELLDDLRPAAQALSASITGARRDMLRRGLGACAG